MKKSILAVMAVLVASIINVQAQTSKSGEVTVNINLHKFQNLTVNHDVVNIDFMTEEHYQSGASSQEMNDHITVSSTGAFTVKANSVTNELVNGKSLGVATSPLTVTMTDGSNKIDDANYVQNAQLVNGETIVSSDKGQFGKNFNVQYHAKSDDFVNMNLIDQKFVTDDENTITYKVNVTYTIAVK